MLFQDLTQFFPGWELAAFNAPLNPLPEVSRSWLPLSFPLCQRPGHPLPVDFCSPCQEQVTPGFFCSNCWRRKREGISTHLLGEEKLFIFPGKGNCLHSFTAKLQLAWHSSHSTARAWLLRGSLELKLRMYILIDPGGMQDSAFGCKMNWEHSQASAFIRHSSEAEREYTSRDMQQCHGKSQCGLSGYLT